MLNRKSSFLDSDIPESSNYAARKIKMMNGDSLVGQRLGTALGEWILEGGISSKQYQQYSRLITESFYRARCYTSKASLYERNVRFRRDSR